MSAPELHAGHIIGGKFTVRRLLGRKELTATYHALVLPSRDVAIKVFDPALRSHGDVEWRLRRVMDAVNGVPASVALPVLEIGVDVPTGAPFIATELSVTPSLAELVHLCPLGPEDLVAFVRSLGRALDALHERGLMHLALAPTNVFVGAAPRFEVRLADFGPRVHVSSGDDAWLAPEQAMAPSFASDVYSAAMVTLFAATGRVWKPTEDGAHAPATDLARQTGVVVDRRLDAPLARALAPDPAQRYGRVSELADALTRALGAESCADPGQPRGESARTDPAPPPEELAPTAPPLPPPPFSPPFDVDGSQARHPAVGFAPGPIPSAVGFATVSTSLPTSPFDAGATVDPASARRRTLMLAAGVGLPLLVLAAVVFVVFARASARARPRSGADASTPPVVSLATEASDDPNPPIPPVAAPPSQVIPAEEPSAGAPGESGVALGAEVPPVPPNAEGKLKVKCVPACSTIKVDGEAVTSFPLTIGAGEHTVVAQRGTLTRTKRVTVRAAKTETLSFTWATAPRAPAKKPCGKFLKRCD